MAEIPDRVLLTLNWETLDHIIVETKPATPLFSIQSADSLATIHTLLRVFYALFLPRLKPLER